MIQWVKIHIVQTSKPESRSYSAVGRGGGLAAFAPITQD